MQLSKDEINEIIKQTENLAIPYDYKAKDLLDKVKIYLYRADYKLK